MEDGAGAEVTAVAPRRPEPGGRARRSGPRPPAWAVGVPAVLLLAASAVLMLRRVEPFVTYYYLFAWYPTLLALDAAQAARTGRYYLATRPRFALSLLGWSAVLWFLFELVNFRVANWYYVFLPPARPVRWAGTTLAFATVLPAIFLAERWLAARRAFERARSPRFRVGRGTLMAIGCAGLLFVALSLTWPRIFFPLVWGALTLLLEPWNCRRDRTRSLLADLADGRPARVLRLLAGGLAIGFLWELYNIGARGKWIYTVPGLEEVKLFEMPLPGFLGFPVFALDCFVFYQSLVLARIAVPPARHRPLRRRRTAVAAALAVVFCAAVLLGMERWTVDSYVPRLEDLPGLEPAAAARLAATPYRDPFALAQAEPAAVARAASASPSQAATWVAAARLATLRGIGAGNCRLLWAAGVRTVAELAAADPDALSRRLQRLSDRPRAGWPPRVRVWVRAARRAAPAARAG